MTQPRAFATVLLTLVLGLRAHAISTPDLAAEAACQKKIASQGARFATRVIRANLKCATETADCQIQCESGVFGPSCDTSPPPCCDPQDPSSNQSFGDCMAAAQATCNQQTLDIATFEAQKQASITSTCARLTDEELCGASAEGLNFATLNAGCAALDPTYTCTLANLINCVGGPLEQQLLGQISATLNPRLTDVVATLPPAIQAKFPGVPIARRKKEDVPAGKADVWKITGQAGDLIVARVKTLDDSGTGANTSKLHPDLELLDASLTPVPDVNVVAGSCPVPNVCGSQCPSFKRTLPDDGTFYIAVRGVTDGGCVGGGYKLVVVSPSGTVPVLTSDDVTPP